jgi:hypothetical protein
MAYLWYHWPEEPLASRGIYLRKLPQCLFPRTRTLRVAIDHKSRKVIHTLPPPTTLYSVFCLRVIHTGTVPRRCPRPARSIARADQPKR